MAKVSQKTKDESGNNTRIFSLFLSTLLTRPVSRNGKFHVKSDLQILFPKPCQCCRQQFFFKDILYFLLQFLRDSADHREQHCNSHLYGDTWLQKSDAWNHTPPRPK